MSVRLTAFGGKSALFYAAMLGAFFASPYSNSFFLLLAFLTLQWALCLVWTVLNLRGLRGSLEHVEPLPSGIAFTLGARVRAARRARFKIVGELELERGAGATPQLVHVTGELACLADDARLELRCDGLERGLYLVRRAAISSSYPLGLFRARRAMEAPRELAVYPAPTRAANARGAADALAELTGRRAQGPGDLQPCGLRDHRDGDERRAIHWRASARRGALVVREWEGGGGDGLEVLLDRRCEPEALEQALCTISALVEVARAGKEGLALHTQGLQERFGPGHVGWEVALRFLATADVLPADAPAPPRVSPDVARLPAGAASTCGSPQLAGERA